MKALLINGSPRPNGCTFTALTELANTLEAEGIETEIVHVGNKDIRGCIACRRCHSTGSNKCVFDDIVNEVAPKLAEADAFVIGAPVYFGSPAGGAISFMDRLFFSTLNIDKTMKVGASVVTCRRGGNTASYDVLNKYFTMCGMPVASSQYWNMVYGGSAAGGKKEGAGGQGRSGGRKGPAEHFTGGFHQIFRIQAFAFLQLVRNTHGAPDADVRGYQLSFQFFPVYPGASGEFGE